MQCLCCRLGWDKFLLELQLIKSPSNSGIGIEILCEGLELKKGIGLK